MMCKKLHKISTFHFYVYYTACFIWIVCHSHPSFRWDEYFMSFFWHFSESIFLICLSQTLFTHISLWSLNALRVPVWCTVWPPDAVWQWNWPVFQFHAMRWKLHNDHAVNTVLVCCVMYIYCYIYYMQCHFMRWCHFQRQPLGKENTQLQKIHAITLKLYITSCYVWLFCRIVLYFSLCLQLLHIIVYY